MRKEVIYSHGSRQLFSAVAVDHTKKFLVHGGRVSRRRRRDGRPVGLCGRPYAQSGLPRNLRRRHGPRGSRQRDVRSGAHRVSRDPRDLLRDARSDPAEPAGQRRRHAVPVGRVHAFGCAARHGARRDPRARARAGVRPADRHAGRAARRQLLAGRGLSPELLRAQPGAGLLLGRDRAEAREIPAEVLAPAEVAARRVSG